MASAMMAVIAFSSAPALAYKVNDDHQIFGLGQVWAVLSEDARNDAKAADDSDGQDSAFGFKAKRFRFGFKGKMVDGLVGYKIQTEFAGSSAGLKDYIMTLNPGAVSIAIGQQKPYTNYDALRSASKLKNIERAAINRHAAASFFVTNNSFRDLGAFLKVKNLGPATLLVSATNGTGAGSGRDVGGSISSGAVFANGAGDAAYGVGVIVKLADGMVRLNGSYMMNKHDNVVLKDDKTAAADVNRSTYSAGFEVDLKNIGLWIDGEYVALTSDDEDFQLGGAETSGYYGRVGFWAMPKTLEVVARYENEDDKGVRAGTKDEAFSTKQITAGVNYYIDKNFKAQLEYAARDYEEGDDDTSIRANFQVKF